MDHAEAAGRPWFLRTTAAAVAVVVLQLLAPVLPAAVAAGAAASADAKIEAGLLAHPEGTPVDFWVTMAAKADLGVASRVGGWKNRGQAVVDRLRQTSTASQAGVTGLLARRGAKHQGYWVANTVKVTGTVGLMRELAARADVEQVLADRTFDLPKPAPATDVAPSSVEWNVGAVQAPTVWDDLSVAGEGIVVANLDTGVQFDHPALVNQYRGNLGGTFDHNYNWFDPSNVCGNPSTVPCDNNQHGTHTMGTIVGDDGTGGNRIGVAPGARWIAVKGCEYSSCSTSALLAGGQWLLAPTDLTGQNPRPELRPNVVNNSWGGGGQNPWFRDIVTAWVAAGMFPVFSNGNSGPSCGTAGSPADYAESYAVGSHNSAGAISSFSSRGSAASALVKPDIAAPGEGVRSSVPGNAYGVLSGTSMAGPHVAGAVALMWSAAPSLVSDVAGTRDILDRTAVDVANLACGGTDADNGVWGEGKLDALAAVLASPRGPVGTVSGVVVDRTTGAPVPGAQIRSVGADPFARVTRTGPTGVFTQVLPVGTVRMDVTAFGFVAASTEVVVVANETATADHSLASTPRHDLAGQIVDADAAPLRDAMVSIPGVPVPAVTTGADGSFRFPGLPGGDYQVTATAGPCSTAATQALHLDADATLDFVVGARRDGFGYGCRQEAPAYIEAGTVVALAGDDSYLAVPLPFPFSYYGRSYPTAYVSTNGMIGLAGGSTVYANGPIPGAAWPNGTIYAFWDDLYVDSASSVRTATLGEEPNRRFVVEWRNVRWYASHARMDLEVVLDQRGGILVQYRRLYDDPLVRGASATIGVEDETGATGLAFSYNTATLQGTSVALRFEAAGSVGNIAPDASDDAATTVAGRAVTFAVLGNDRDPDGGTLEVTGVADPLHGTAAVGSDDTITYVPDAGFSGTEVFTYDLADGRGGTDRASVSVTVAPLAVDDTGTTAEDTPVSVDVLANDLNPQAGTLDVDAVVTPPQYGTAAVGAGDVLQYTPRPDFNGTDRFTYSVRDGRGGVDHGTVTVTVSAVDDPPQAVDDSIEVAQDGAVTAAVLANDIEVDGDQLEIVAVSDPPRGSVSVNADRTVTYRPDTGYSGADSFTYDAGDGRGGVSRARVSVTVHPTTTTTTTLPPTTTTTTVPPTTTTTTVPPTTTTTRPPGATTPRSPYSVWTQGSPAALDGTGTWLAIANDPTPSPGQLLPEYVYGLGFGFASSTARGVVGLATGPSGKTAELTVTGPTGPPQRLVIPFNWTADRFYFVFVHQLEPGRWGALVFDLAADTWTPIGAVTVPAEWGRLSPTTITAASWSGSSWSFCASYPRAEVVVHSPTGFVGGAATEARFVQGGAADGACGSEHAIGPGGWIRYRMGTP
jgi:subtilisin family serine protease